jgi:polar amino acid transport system substrate-binding protein
MANRLIRTLSLAVLVALVGALAFAQGTTLDQIQQRGYVRIATANEIPYGFVDASGDAKGIAPEVATAVLNNMGITDIQWVVTEFGSLIPGLKADRFDLAAASQAILPARCQQVVYSKPNSSYGEGLLVKAGNPDNIHGYEAFVQDSSLKMGIVSGADQLDMAHAMGIPDNQLVAIPSNTDALSAVETGRIDAYAATGLTAARLAENSDKVELAEPFNDPVIDGKPVRSWGGFTFNMGSKDFRDAFNTELAKFQQTDAYRQILTGYGLSNQDVDLALAKTTEELCSAQ